MQVEDNKLIIELNSKIFLKYKALIKDYKIFEKDYNCTLKKDLDALIDDEYSKRIP